jgi:hypothetical protein
MNIDKEINYSVYNALRIHVRDSVGLLVSRSVDEYVLEPIRAGVSRLLRRSIRDTVRDNVQNQIKEYYEK